ncbi:hypothetical protein QYF61_007562 [Mycteria americana]|uniref:Uncharacterized protein n=1 Tax=Mycteria americana TaxID=33587 RepID=A0AAN7MT49_MYCAM|nr:hypothetical protein QYF61_007562 [Mycteria americana]
MAGQQPGARSSRHASGEGGVLRLWPFVRHQRVELPDPYGCAELPDLDRLQEWASRNLKKVDKDKCTQEGKNPHDRIDWELTDWGAALQRRT